MKKIEISIIAFLAFFAISAQQSSAYKDIVDRDILAVIRKGYYKAVDNPDSAEVLYRMIEKEYGAETDKYNPIIKSYYACLKGLKGKFASNVYVKYKYVSSAAAIIDNAVEQFPDCLEIRFLRFSFFYYLPKVFDIDKKLHEDLRYLTGKFNDRDYTFVPPHLQRDMIDFTIHTGLLSASEYKEMLDIIIEIMKMEIDSNASKKQG